MNSDLPVFNEELLATPGLWIRWRSDRVGPKTRSDNILDICTTKDILWTYIYVLDMSQNTICPQYVLNMSLICP